MMDYKKKKKNKVAEENSEQAVLLSIMKDREVIKKDKVFGERQFNKSLANDIKKWTIALEEFIDDAMNAYHNFLLKSQEKDKNVFDEFEEDELNSDEKALLNLVGTFDVKKLSLEGQHGEKDLALLQLAESGTGKEIFTEATELATEIKKMNVAEARKEKEKKQQEGKTSSFKLKMG